MGLSMSQRHGVTKTIASRYTRIANRQLIFFVADL